MHGGSSGVEHAPGATKAERYAHVHEQLSAVVSDEPDALANLCNVLAVLKHALPHMWWVGVYVVRARAPDMQHQAAAVQVDRVGQVEEEEEEELVLGPFQGPLACTRIAHERGVCGAAWRDARTMVVPDVDAFPGHIACSSASRSEIVIPLFGVRDAGVHGGASSTRAAGDADDDDDGDHGDDGDAGRVVVGVLDIDSEELSMFDEETDAVQLGSIAKRFIEPYMHALLTPRARV